VKEAGATEEREVGSWFSSVLLLNNFDSFFFCLSFQFMHGLDGSNSVADKVVSCEAVNGLEIETGQSVEDTADGGAGIILPGILKSDLIELRVNVVIAAWPCTVGTRNRCWT
jgi:hypothetical protein